MQTGKHWEKYYLQNPKLSKEKIIKTGGVNYQSLKAIYWIAIKSAGNGNQMSQNEEI